MTTVVIAPNAFKGSLTAVQAAAAMAAGAATALPDAVILARPIADGGDGSVDALLAAGFTRADVSVRSPAGHRATAPVALRDGEAVIEVANTCGLLLVPEALRDPMGSNTFALGEAVRAALDLNVRSIVLCMGGSASTDGGVGLLRALGARIFDAQGHDLPPGGQWLDEIVSVDVSDLDPRLRSTRITVATDVASPLLGDQGAARLFSPQKGATPDQVAVLENGLRSWATVVAEHTGRDCRDVPGAGAAGGTAFAAIALLGAGVVSGAEYIAEAAGLPAAISTADLVMTGEGALDAQSLLGKGAVYVARLAQAAHVPCVMVCGRIDLAADSLEGLGVVAAGALIDIAEDPSNSMERAAGLLARRTIDVVSSMRA